MEEEPTDMWAVITHCPVSELSPVMEACVVICTKSEADAAEDAYYNEDGTGDGMIETCRLWVTPEAKKQWLKDSPN